MLGARWTRTVLTSHYLDRAARDQFAACEKNSRLRRLLRMDLYGTLTGRPLFPFSALPPPDGPAGPSLLFDFRTARPLHAPPKPRVLSFIVFIRLGQT